MLVTCYCDASYAAGTGGAWAVWLRSSEGRVVRSGSCPGYVRDSNLAELSAIWAGIYLALRTWPETTAILVCSDCQGALAIAANHKPPKKSEAKRIWTMIRKALVKANTKLVPRWVRGHQDASAGTQAYLNNACDRLAGLQRRRDRELSHPVARVTDHAVSKAEPDPTQRRVSRSVRIRQSD